MKRYAFLSIVAVATLIATALHAAKTLPEKTSLEQYVPFMQKAAGEVRNPEEVKEPMYGRGFKIVAGPVEMGVFENPNAGKTIDQIMKAKLDALKFFCDDLKSTVVARQTLDGLVLLRVTAMCKNLDLESEELVIADRTRHQIYSLGTATQHKAQLTGIGNNIFNALVAMYR